MPKNQNVNRPKPRKMRKKKSRDNSPIETKEPVSPAEINTKNSSPIPEEKNLGDNKSPNPLAETEKTVAQQKPLSDPAGQNWQEQYETLNKKYQFLMADYANYKKNCLKEIGNLRKYGGEHLIKQLLSLVMDNFDRALEKELNTQNIDDFKKGVSMIYANLKTLLKENGVKEIECQGQLFDPVFHYALDSAPSEEVPPEHILQVIKKAYLFHDKLIRPAEVIVAKNIQKTTSHKSKDTGE